MSQQQARPMSREDPIGDLQSVAVLVIDVQEYCSIPNRGYHKDVSRQDMPYFFDRVDMMVSNIDKLLKSARSNKVEVIYTYIEALTKDGRDSSLDYKLSGPLLVPKDHQDARILDAIKPAEDDILIPKTSCSVFQSTNIDYVLRNLGTKYLIVCGQLTNQCVESAVRDAADLGYLVTVVEDACSAETNEAHESALRNLKGFSRICSAEAVIKEFNNPETKSCTSQANKQVESKTTECVNKQNKYEPSTNEVLTGLVTTLKVANVKYLRVLMCDSSSVVRTKAINITTNDVNTIRRGVAVVDCIMGLPLYGDVIAQNSKLSPSGISMLAPDFSSLRIPPYAPKHAVVYGYFCNDERIISEMCPRGFLKRMERLCQAKDLDVQVGCEIEFTLRDSKDDTPVDETAFASNKALDKSYEFVELLDEMLAAQNVKVLQIHPESCHGQFEVVLKHSSNLIEVADAILTARQTISATASKFGLKASFAPKPMEMQAGNGSHLHFSCKNQGKFMAGILEHLPSLIAIVSPSPNSFRRMQPGCWAGKRCCWGVENKEAPIRLCDNGKHFECKSVDSMCNPYLAIGSMIAAGLHGITNDSKLPPPVNVDPATLDVTENLRDLPDSLEEALNLLENNSVITGVLGDELTSAYIAVKRGEALYFQQNAPTLEKELAIIDNAF